MDVRDPAESDDDRALRSADVRGASTVCCWRWRVNVHAADAAASGVHYLAGVQPAASPRNDMHDTELLPGRGYTRTSRLCFA